MLITQFLWLFSVLIMGSYGKAIDNGVLGVPKLDCFENGLRVSFETEKPFTGRVFVKGMGENPRCSHDFTHSTHTRSISLSFDSVDCAMERQRKPGEDGGIVNALSILVMFHGTFVTKVDRTYKCMCFFRRQARVTNMLYISDIAPTDLTDERELATCRYTIRQGSPNGPELRYARVGDPIYHTWECDDDNLGILVHSCWANDGTGQQSKFDFYDRDGCAVDPIIMPDINYDQSQRRAWVEAHGFKFSTSTTLRFSCMLETCSLSSGDCTGVTPPRCNSFRGSQGVGVESYPGGPTPGGSYVAPPVSHSRRPGPPPQIPSRPIGNLPYGPSVESRVAPSGNVVFGPPGQRPQEGQERGSYGSSRSYSGGPTPGGSYVAPPVSPRRPGPPPQIPSRPIGNLPYGPSVESRVSSSGNVVFEPGPPGQRPQEGQEYGSYGSSRGGQSSFGPPSPRGGLRVVARPSNAPRGQGYRSRSKRDLEVDWEDEEAYDVLASITVFDRYTDDGDIFPFGADNLTDSKEDTENTSSNSQTCISTPAFTSLVAVTAITLITSAITTSYIALTRRIR